ncbi:unnamed protein product [Cylindrotheca closterium]|uniref:Glycine zipper domain-containing protein n=1 Tax=Cylindrotheca closterium TaxID=2856 RepID=A0AAD2JJG8_9STRA|nr:unnamed protein product [Cylindrotheca closterium]
MSGYTNYQLPPNYGYQQQQQQQQQYQQYHQQQQQQQQYPTQYPQYTQTQTQSNDAYYAKPAPAPVSAPLPNYVYQQSSSPAPSLYSASTMSSYSTPSAGSSDDLMGFYSPSPAMTQQQQQSQQQPMVPRPVTPDHTARQLYRPDSNEDMQAIVASQERALVQSSQGQPRTVPIVERKDYVVPRDVRGKHVISDGIHPEKYEMKKSRKQRTVAGATSGAIVGGLLAGPAFPVGMAIGGAVGGYASNKLHKVQERRRQRRHEQRTFQKGAKNSVFAKSNSSCFV